MNVYLKWLKDYLALGVKNIGSIMTLICVNFLDFLFFNFRNLSEFLAVSSALLPPTPLTTSLPQALNRFEAKSDNSVISNMKVSDITILLKLQMKHQ